MRQYNAYGFAWHHCRRLFLTGTSHGPFHRESAASATANGESVTGSCAVEPLANTTDSASQPVTAGALFVFPAPVPYSMAWELQSRLHHERLSGARPDTVVILEHQPVFTLGRSTRVSDWGGDEALLRANGTALHRVNRGGSATYHGPGQIVVYPILRLVQYAAGPKRLVWLFEDVMLRVLKRWGITGHRIEKKPGIWTMTPQPAKIASIGIRVDQGITLHGFALNVDMDLAPFQRIHPCGFVDCLVTSMRALRGTALSIDEIKQDLARTFSEVLSIEWTAVEDNPDKYLAAADETVRRCPSTL
jgi:lipoyl(octanoyl) transferase